MLTGTHGYGTRSTTYIRASRFIYADYMVICSINSQLVHG